MALSINTNLMAGNSARMLNSHYNKLATSTQRLSSGLRINSAADDAAGLAVREMMRSDISTLGQGIRNANDAISMIQTADGALAVIDEKLIRMKELAEQASTGTYNSVQRMIIDSEFQAMSREIDRIANSTDFNGIKLLDGSRRGRHDGSGLNSTGSSKIHFGTGNDSAEDYYYMDINNCTTAGLLFPDIFDEWPGATYSEGRINLDLSNVLAGNNSKSVPGLAGVDYYSIPVGLKDITISSRDHTGAYAHKPHVNLFTSSGQQLTGVDPQDPAVMGTANPGANWWNGQNQAQVIAAGQRQGLFQPGATYVNSIINNAGQTLTNGDTVITMLSSQTEGRANAWETMNISEVTDDLVFMVGGHLHGASCNDYDLKISAKVPLDIKTQEDAQKMLTRIDSAIATKDNIRARLGALQNRLENTVTNLQTQAENLQASESRISDTDVATEMTSFVRQQILTQGAIAMLSQANSLPKMAMNIIGG